MYFNDSAMDINRNNYETFFLIYLDRELSHADMHAVEKFLNENTDLQKEFSLLQQTILVPEELVFEHRELLLHKEEKRKPVPIHWIRIAASIAVLLTAGWLIMKEVSKNHKGGIARKVQAPALIIPSKKIPGNIDLSNKNQKAQIEGKGIEKNKHSVKSSNQDPQHLTRKNNSEQQEVIPIP